MNFPYLFLICLLATFLRFYQLGQIPNSVSADEAAFGYNAYSILSTGRDEYGQKFPLLFKSFDDHKNPVFVYLLVPDVALFGLNELAIRLPSAIVGVLIIPLFYLLTKRLTGNETTSFLAAFLAAVCPWLVHYSRLAVDMNTALFFSLLAVWLFLAARKKNWLYIISALNFSLAFWSYYPAKLWVTLFGIFLVIFRVWQEKKLNKYIIAGLLIFVFFSFPGFKIFLQGQSSPRAYGISVFSNEDLRIRDAQLLAKDIKSGDYLGKLVHNRRLTFLNQFVNGYLEITNPKIIFGQDLPNHIQSLRLLYLWQIPLIVLGLIVLSQKRKNIFIIVSVWLVLGYIPGAITLLPPFDRRILVNSFPLIFLTVVGLVELFKFLDKQRYLVRLVSWFTLLLILTFSVTAFLHFYFDHGRGAVISLWGNGMRELVTATAAEGANYQKVVISNLLDQPYIYFLFYEKYPPKQYLAEGGTISGSVFAKLNRFSNYEFRRIEPGELRANILYIWPAGEIIPCTQIKKTIYQTNGRPLANIGVWVKEKEDCQPH